MANLLKETKEILEQRSKTFDDVLFVGDGSTHTKMTVKEFLEHANVHRHEYDGSEWWEYKSMPNINDFVDGVVYIFDEAKMNAMYYC